jgi:hypothetical protein
MEPKLPTPSMGPERSSGFYNQPIERPSSSPERNEREAQRVEHYEPSQERTQPTLPPPIAPVPSINVTPAGPTTPSAAADAPLIANDDDLIEKEWVDRAKQIIANTRDDPYQRELEVGRLQADYLKKRYGKDLGAPQ